MSVLYFKVLTEYYHHIVGDLSEKKKIFLEDFHRFLLARDDYGYLPDLNEELGRIDYLLRQIGLEAKGMSIDEYIKLKKWYFEDGWAADEIDEYFLYFKKDKEIKIIYDFHSLTEEEIKIFKSLNSFLENKGKSLKVFNPHNGKYQKINEVVK